MRLKTAYFPNYYSIDDILATQERIPCKFLADVPKMGVLNPSADEKDLKVDTNLELPFWMVQEMIMGRQPIVSAELPKVYREAYREILQADASAVDLHKFNLFYYELGSYVKGFDRRGDVHNILMHTFTTRFRQLMDLADNTVADPLVQTKLDMLERRLLNDAQKARAKLDCWLIESGIRMEAAEMVVNHKKRKRVDVDEII